MNAWVLALIPAALGVDYGWERKPDGSIVYIIQVEPEAVESMKTGAELVGALPPELRNITNYKIRLGRDILPNHNQLPPEISNRNVAPPPSPLPAVGSQPLANSGYNSKSNYQTQPNYVGTPGTSTAPASVFPGGPTSTSGFPMAGPTSTAYGYPGSPTTQPGSNPGYVGATGQPAYGAPTPNYQPQAAPTGTAGYVYNPATNSYVPAASPTLPTGTPAGGWTVSPVAGSTQPTYGQPNYGTPPVLNPATGQPTNSWASNPNTAGYPQPQPGVTGPILPDGQYVARPPLDGTQQPPPQQGFGANNSAGPVANPAATAHTRPPEPQTAGPTKDAQTPPAAPKEDKSLGWMGTLIVLFASLGFNLWSGWNLYNLRERYRSLLSERVPAY